MSEGGLHEERREDPDAAGQLPSGDERLPSEDPEDRRREREDAEEPVERGSKDSFPASDPPSTQQPGSI